MRQQNPVTALAVFGLSLWLASPAWADPGLAKKHGCLGCHAQASKLVGPSYADVAAKYGKAPGAAAQLAQRIRAGGSGAWGDMAMPPQPQVSKADALKLSTWILGSAK